MKKRCLAFLLTGAMVTSLLTPMAGTTVYAEETVTVENEDKTAAPDSSEELVAEDEETTVSEATEETVTEIVEKPAVEEKTAKVLNTANVVGEGTCGENLTWQVTEQEEGNVLTISGMGAMLDYTHSTNEAPWKRLDISEIIIEDGVTSIGAYAFSNCTGLNGKITISDSVLSIGEYAFYNSTGLSGELVLPDSVTNIGISAFTGCSGLTGKLVIPENVVKISNSVFSGCSGLNGELVIPDGVTSIESYAFNGCTNLTGGLNIPDSVTSIGKYAFNKCSGLNGELVLSANVTSIGDYTFEGCSSLTGKLEIPNGVTSIGYAAFYDCSGLTGELEIPDSVKTIGEQAFNGCSGLTGIRISENVSEIAMGAFANCSGLSGELVIPKSVINIGYGAFDTCSGLSSVEIPGSVTKISRFAFRRCSGLKGEIVIPSSVATIDYGAFYNCTGIVAISISNNKCTISDVDVTFPTQAIICCSSDSTAYAYAKKYGRKVGCTSHKWEDDYTTDKEATCMEEGVKSIHCSLCDMTKDVITTEKTDHIYGKWIVDKEATYTESGSRHKECSCGHRVEEVIPQKAEPVASGTCGNNLTWELDINGKLTVSGTGQMKNYSYSGNTPWRNKGVKEVVIEDGVTTIGDYAFEECGYLEKITISDSVTEIGESVFSDCDSLENVVLPHSITKMGLNVFNHCNNLQSATLSNGLAKVSTGTFQYCRSLKEIVIPDSVTTIDSYAFSDCDSLESIVIPYSVTKIGDNIFYKSESGLTIKGYNYSEIYRYAKSHNISFESLGTNIPLSGTFGNNLKWQVTEREKGNLLTISGTGSLDDAGPQEEWKKFEIVEVKINKGITDIAAGMFEEYNLLKSVTIPNSVKTIWSGAFVNCSALEEITIPEGVTNIWAGAFLGCSSLKTVKLPNSLESMEGRTFEGCSSLEEIIIPNSVYYIGDSTFKGCNSLKKVTISDRMGTIGSNTFEGCSSLKEIIIPNNVCAIKDYAFKGCSSLEEIIVPYEVTKIESNTFEGCSSLIKVELPKGITEIGSSAFKGCSSLEEITIPTGITTIKTSTFEGCSSLKAIELPKGLTEIESSAFEDCSLLEEITIPTGITTIKTSTFRGCSSLKAIELPKGLTEIESSVFSGCSSLRAIELPEGITKIGSSAFSGCSSLKNVELPVNVTEIANYTFSGCSSLEKMELSERITKIGGGAFKGCSSIKEIIIPDNVTSIYDYTFSECSSLEKILIPDSVTNIAKTALLNSNKNLVIVGINPSAAYTYAKENGFLFSTIIAGTCGEALIWWFFEDGTLLIKGKGEMDSYDIDRPAPWITLDINEVVVSEGVTSIGSSAFEECKEIQKVTLPDSLKNVGIYAFCNCTNITSVKLVNPEIVIGINAFKGCDNLIIQGYEGTDAETYAKNNDIKFESFGAVGKCGTKINWKYEKKDSILYIQGNGEMQDYPSGIDSKDVDDSKYNSQAPWAMCDIKECIVSDGVTSIGAGAFAGCNNLVKVDIPQSVTSIGNEAFAGCEKLSDIKIDGITSLGQYAFAGCTNLSEVKLSSALTILHKAVFYKCSSLSQITLTDKIKKLDELCLAETAITSLNIPAAVTELEPNMTRGCSVLAEFTVAQNNTTYSAMSGMLYNYAGNELVLCPGSKSGNVALPRRVVRIGNRAFTGCDAVTGITLFEGLEEIGDCAFEGTSISELNIPSTVNVIGNQVFCKAKKLAEIIVDKANETYKSTDGVLYSKDGTTLFAYPPAKEGTVILSNTVMDINGYAFYNCSKTDKVILSENIKYIGAKAFVNSGIKELTIPMSDIKISDEVIVNKDVLIKGYLYSTAKLYAEEHGLLFESIGYSTNKWSDDDAHIKYSYQLLSQWLKKQDNKTYHFNNGSQDLRVQLKDDGTIKCKSGWGMYAEEGFISEISFTMCSNGIVDNKVSYEYTHLILDSTYEATGYAYIDPNTIYKNENYDYYTFYLSRGKNCTTTIGELNRYANITIMSGLMLLEAFVLVEAGVFSGDLGIYYIYEPTDNIHWPTESDRIEPTCSQPGHTSGRYCSICGAVDVDEEEIPINPDAHKYGEWKVSKEADCANEGLKERECEYCHKVEEVTLPALAHNWQDEYTIDKEPTCMEKGSESIHCENCTATMSARDIPKTEHDFGEGIITRESTCSTSGVRSFECKAEGCDEIKTEEEPLNPEYHVWEEEYTIDVPASCSEKGSMSKHCSECDMIDDNSVKEIDAYGHKTSGVYTFVHMPDCEKGAVLSLLCDYCDYEFEESRIETHPLGHTHKKVITKATTSKNGAIKYICDRDGCNHVDEARTVTIYKPSKMTLSTTTYTYNGKEKKPTVEIKDTKGNKISSSNYSVDYAKGRKNVGKYAVKVTFKGNYSGTMTQYLTINPKGTTLSSLSKASKAFTAKWKKQSTQVTGYQIQYSTSKKFTSAKTVTVSSYKTTSKKITKLSAKKTYYVRIRTYKTVGKTKFYSGWSSVKSVKTK